MTLSLSLIKPELAHPVPLKRRHNKTRCRNSREDLTDSSCYAHSVEYDISSNKIRPLELYTDTWCSSGSFLSNGTLLQLGGFGKGSRRIRYFRPCGDRGCDWKQSKRLLFDGRWYASNLLLPEDDRVIVVGGRREFSYEFVPKISDEQKSFGLPFLHRTYNRNAGGSNLYPFLHLLQTETCSFRQPGFHSLQLQTQQSDQGLPSYPRRRFKELSELWFISDPSFRSQNKFQKVEVMVCGGSASGAYQAAREGHVLIINGAKSGSAGYNNARNASLQPYLYKPKKTLGRRFSVLKSTRIARMYHSSAILLPDGRVLIGGGNPHNRYVLRNVAYPTELRLQAFVPHYMDRQYHNLRPSNLTIHYGHRQQGIEYGGEFGVQFHLGPRTSNVVEFTAYVPPFSTHSLSMNQRMLKLRCKSMVRAEGGLVNVVLEAPPSPNVAPPVTTCLQLLMEEFLACLSGLGLASIFVFYCIEMASEVLPKVAYYRLRNELGGVDYKEAEEEKALKKIRRWYKIRKLSGRKRQRIRIPGLRKFLRKRGRFLPRLFKVSLAKALRRLKDGQAHMNDLFGGNYLFMQPNPIPFRCGTQRAAYMGHPHGLHGLPTSKYALGRIA
ncbi:hypothetical protein FNV43_RR19530 [Rhamnella rubrinervis]|uniref:Uncharacterized protein n=1 Tax=Rhamnella rubrinervis TaxID=2594499 RepID=A0A8K0E4N7_9ROSA|nr:hypothetical protein FNV43_RR19530 [Rhamnella rubrinervis]